MHNQAISGEVPATCTEEVLRRISAGMYDTMFADHVTFVVTLQRHNEDFSSLQQRMADCYKALFTDKSVRAQAYVAIIHPANAFKIIHELCKLLIQLPC